MNIKLLLAPALLQILLTFMLLLRLGYLRVSSVRRGEIKLKDISLGQSAWPENITKVDRCFHNQFETPMLFFVLIAFVGLTAKVNLAFVVMSWLFVIFRYLHALELINNNFVPNRLKLFLVSAFTLIGMWLYFAFLILFK